MEFHLAAKSHCHRLNAFQQKYPGETASNVSTITHFVQRFHDKGSVEDRKQSGRLLFVNTKVIDVETALQRSSMKSSRKLAV
ncbi:hypothetical protein TNCV_1025011 [Trichonephila clavipes]|nr:hypothetical protein TNCV_1025011 [Trichonephila clavipes]